MIENIYSIISLVIGIYLIIYTFAHIRKGIIKTPSIWDKKPISFKQKPLLAYAIAVVQFILGIALVSIPLFIFLSK